jgi:hypothetical protein
VGLRDRAASGKWIGIGRRSFTIALCGLLAALLVGSCSIDSPLPHAEDAPPPVVASPALPVVAVGVTPRSANDTPADAAATVDEGRAVRATAAGDERWPLRVQVVDTFDDPVVAATIELREAAFGSPIAVARSGAKGLWKGVASGDNIFSS